MVSMPAHTRHLSLFQRIHARIRGLTSAPFYGLLLVGLLAGCGSGGSSSGGTTAPTAQATAGPTIQSIPPSVAVVGKTLTYDVDATDANSATLIYSLTVAPAGMSIVPATGVITWAPQATQVGDNTVSITASDGLNSTTQTFVLAVFGVTQELASVPISSATGGTVTVNAPTSSLNGLTLTFPPNALPGDTTIKVRELTTSPTLAGGLRGFSLEPDGLVLNSPVTVTIPFDPAALNSGGGIVLPDFLGVFFIDPKTGRQVLQDTFRVDDVQNVLVGTLDHFSEYFNVTIGRLCPPPTAVSHPTEESLCPPTYIAVPSKYLPSLLVHGFRFGQLGDESTWGELRTLLGIPPPVHIPFAIDPQDRIEAWRFDYNALGVSFRKSAWVLAAAIGRLKRETNQPAVNVVAHSFGGILARTYLQGMASADGTGNPAGPYLSYQGNINKLMTLGTPHRGIGNTFSLLWADECADESGGQVFQLPTCFEAATGILGKGSLLRALNFSPLPPLVSVESPQYLVIIGQRFQNGKKSDGLADDDGLIKTAGADICVALGGLPAIGNGERCSTSANISVRIIANNRSERFGLCHTDLGPVGDVDGNCGGLINVPMAAVNNVDHPSWKIIREFLTTGSAASTPTPPAVFATLTVTTLGNGTVTSNPAGIQCGATCLTNFENGTAVTLSPLPNSGFVFSGWSGACINKVGPCKLAINGNTSVQAIYTPQISPPPQYQGIWSATGSMATSRIYHTATRLLNGKVLVVGGQNSTTVLANAELYDPAANGGVGAWSTTGSLATARHRHTATLLLNGKVLVVGGNNGGGTLASAELYDPAANGGAGAWTPTGSLAATREFHAATLLLNGKVLVVGGGNGGSTLASAELYDPSANGGLGAWSPTGSLATMRQPRWATLLLNGKVLVVGGADPGGGSCSSAELYDPEANGGAGAWGPTGSLTRCGSGVATALSNGKVLVAGGYILAQFSINFTSSAELYDPAANGGAGAWSATGSLATARDQLTATRLLNGKVLVVGGGVSNNFFTDHASAELYDPAANGGAGAWSTTGSLATARNQPTATLLLNGKVLVVGGAVPGGVLASAELFQ